MTGEDFSRIENASPSVRLPEVYRSHLAPFPVPRESGNAELQVWDDAGALIALNRRLLAGAIRGLVFAVGRGCTGGAGRELDSPGVAGVGNFVCDRRGSILAVRRAAGGR